MPEDTALTPDQQVRTPDQQASAPAQQQQGGEDWKKRYDGLVKKTEELVGEIKTLKAELATKTSEIEQLNGQLSLKDVEKSAAVGERDKNIEKLVLDNQSAQKELERLKALELKIKVANELGQPELIKLADTIPNMTDEDALKTVMKNIADYASIKVQEREKQILAGTAPIAGTGNAPAPGPSSQNEWMEHIEKFPLGSRDRATALDKYGQWLEDTHRGR